jgi:F-type H+-transporting ATPase subunit b
MATTAHTEAQGGPKGAFPPFQKDTFASQLVWLAIFFVLLYLLMSRVAIPRIGGIMQARADRISDDLAEAGRLKDQSDAALKGYEQSLADARNRAQTLANQTRERLNAQADEARKRLEAELNDKIAAAERTIASTKSAAMANVRGIAVDTAGAIVERLIGSPPATASVESAVADALKEPRAS